MTEDPLGTSGGMRALVLCDGAGVRRQFLAAYDPDIQRCAETFAALYRAFRLVEASSPTTKRSATTEAFLFAATNSLVTSLSLLVTGRIVPAGNLMRHYGEATAMALLCCHKQIPEYERFHSSPERYPIHKAMNRVATKRNA